MKSITCIRSASVEVRFEATSTAFFGQVVLRWCVCASALSEATASWITLRRRSLPRFCPLESIGVDDPMFDVGDMASTSAACETHTRADADVGPPGETRTTTGTRALGARR